MADIEAYKSETKSVGSGQVLTCPYPCGKTRMAVWEMPDQVALDLVGQRLVTTQLTLPVGHDIDNLRGPERRKQYHGTASLDSYTAFFQCMGCGIHALDSGCSLLGRFLPHCEPNRSAEPEHAQKVCFEHH